MKTDDRQIIRQLRKERAKTATQMSAASQYIQRLDAALSVFGLKRRGRPRTLLSTESRIAARTIRRRKKRGPGRPKSKVPGKE